MILQPYKDRYQISWDCHNDDAKHAIQWCYETFGSGWGEYVCGIPNWTGYATYLFRFHRLSHANWFRLKFDKN